MAALQLEMDNKTTENPNTIPRASEHTRPPFPRGVGRVFNLLERHFGLLPNRYLFHKS